MPKPPRTEHGQPEEHAKTVGWHPGLWRSRPIAQYAPWGDEKALAGVRTHIRQAPPLSTYQDVQALRTVLTQVSAGDGFILQAGDCAEPFGPELVNGVAARDRLMSELATELSGAIGKPIVSVGRIAGQFAKPRSQPNESVGDVELPSFRGLIVNGAEFEPCARDSDPSRMVTAYYNSKAVIHELHRLAHEAASGLLTATDELEQHAGPYAIGRDLNTLSAHSSSSAINGSLSTILPSYGSTVRLDDGTWQARGMWTSHEALLLDYEEQLARHDPETNCWYLASTHLPWIGERTRDPQGAHVRFLAGIANPVAMKVGPNARIEEVLKACQVLDPLREPGRLSLVLRLGRGGLDDRIPEIVSAVAAAGHPVIWMCDPMHGNTETLANGIKTRRIADVVAEVRGFVHAVSETGHWPGGVHLELTPDDVSECVDLEVDDLEGAEHAVGRSYRSLCDPRLNVGQSRQVVAELCRHLATVS